MTDQTTQRGIFLGRVLRHRTPCPEHFEVTLSVEGFPPAKPGQFVQVRCGHLSPGDGPKRGKEAGRATGSTASESATAPSPLLRRPFSIAGMRRSGGQCELDFLGRVVGNGTAWLAGLSPDSLVDVLGPLGQGFSPPSSGKRALLVAGGIGLPPIRWLGEELRRNGVVCDSIYGVRTRDSLPVNLNEEPSPSGALTLCVEEFGRDGIPTCITTDDGTCGLHGRVTDGMTSYFDGCDDPTSIQIYACGPEPMLRAVAAVSESRGLMCELALERMMGCGMGTCQSCVVRVVDESSTAGWRYALCCTEGPVFESSRVIWT